MRKEREANGNFFLRPIITTSTRLLRLTFFFSFFEATGCGDSFDGRMCGTLPSSFEQQLVASIRLISEELEAQMFLDHDVLSQCCCCLSFHSLPEEILASVSLYVYFIGLCFDISRLNE